MNRYTINFKAKCPSDGELVEYELTVETPDPLMATAEDIIDAVDAYTDSDPMYHEHIANSLAQELSGKQTLVARHCAGRVLIVTTR